MGGAFILPRACRPLPACSVATSTGLRGCAETGVSRDSASLCDLSTPRKRARARAAGGSRPV
ncbi:hypothetical protein BD626DRAFT_478597 [Schizophyllum amplum]|uniref:Uncharacterized protein n=1 Tax=Schizophyllum amplum TaxID=97359 RepID=A0A550CRE8_9AGAR|nr:hypothetical protein BD626DRAFT_478542 [Auriculariopsis ampla]TRM67365.1 hypothetical protein BD626DRAFT_478597 [Auriculariopsis ampla]